MLGGIGQAAYERSQKQNFSGKPGKKGNYKARIDSSYVVVAFSWQEDKNEEVNQSNRYWKPNNLFHFTPGSSRESY